MSTECLSQVVNRLQVAVQGDPFWESYLTQLTTSNSAQFALHLAILVEPYLQFVLDGKKTVESRFSTRRFAPYRSIDKGDIILLKRSGGPIVGMCLVDYAWFYRLDPRSWQTIKEGFTNALCAQDPTFWKDRESASYATLIRIQHVRSIAPIKWVKRDRRGWVILLPNFNQLELVKL